MSRQKLKSPSTSPAKNTPANYESAAREIKQEKQMVAALKRLSIGHMMNLDPDIPALDASVSFLVDKEFSGERSANIDAVSGSLLAPQIRLETAPLSVETPPDFDAHLALKPSLKRLLRLDSTDSDVSASTEHTQVSSAAEEAPSEDVLWVPANIHPEMNPQQNKTHVKSTFGELLERKLSRSKLAGRLRRSSLSLLTTDEPQTNDENSESSNTDTRDSNKEPADTLEVEDSGRANRLSNPSLRKLTSELQTMSRLAGMDSTDAVTLARLLSTSSLGYCEVERTAIDEIEHASNFQNSMSHAQVVDVGYEADPSFSSSLPTASRHYGLRSSPASPQMYSLSSGSRRMSGSRSDSPYRYLNSDHAMNEGFSLRRSRRIDYRKGPATSLLGTQLQNNKAGKLAQLRHRLTSDHDSGRMKDRDRDSEKDRLSVGQADARNSMQSMQSINPRSSQVLFSYKIPAQSCPSGHSKTSNSRRGQSSQISLDVLSAKDSRYLTAMASDALGRNLYPTKFSERNLTTKTLGHPKALNSSGSVAQSGHRPYAGDYERQSSHSLFQLSQQNANIHESQDSGTTLWKSRGSPCGGHSSSHGGTYNGTYSGTYNATYSGHRQISPTSPVAPSFSGRSSSGTKESPVMGRNQWLDLRVQTQLQKRYVYAPAISGGVSPVLQQSPALSAAPVSEKRELKKMRLFTKRDKTLELSQDLDLLRNEINEFKESLATKSDAHGGSKVQVPPQEPFQKETKVQDDQVDFSFGLTHQDVSYEDSLGIEKKVISELQAEREFLLEHVTVSTPLSMDPGVLHFTDLTEDEFVSVPDSTDAESLGSKKLSVDIDQAVSEIREPSVLELTKPEKVVEIVEIEEPKNHSEVLKESEEQTVATDCETDQGLPGVPEVKPHILSQHKSYQTLSSTDQYDTDHDDQISRNSTAESLASIEKQRLSMAFGTASKKTKTLVKKRSRKNWPWSKEKFSGSQGKAEESIAQKDAPARSTVRSVSSPELTGSKRDSEAVKEDRANKENVISKFFKWGRNTSESTEKHTSEPFHAMKSNESVETERERDSRTHHKSKGKRHSKGSERRTSEESLSRECHSKELKRVKLTEENKHSDDHSVSSRIKNRIKNMKKIHEAQEEKSSESAEVRLITTTTATTSEAQEEPSVEENTKPKSTVEVQEKLKKSIKRYSRPNQPIEFTDSAFGFPLPPPSSSTLVMIDYRFPVHVERAIYRLSHLKLANPKRSLREQVILSNFMYAYLNLVDHTLHLEQMTENYDVEAPEGDLDFLRDQDVDTEFEAGDGFDDDFKSIKIDLEVKDNQISV